MSITTVDKHVSDDESTGVWSESDETEEDSEPLTFASMSLDSQCIVSRVHSFE